MAEEGMKFEIELDIDKLQAQAKHAQKEMEDISRKAVAEGQQIDSAFRKIGASIGAYFAVGQIRQFADEVVNVRKEMQGFQISLSTLLGSQKAGMDMFNELKQFAVTTPLMLKDLAAGAQTMLGFNIEAEKVVPTLKAIGDISMGDAQRFQSLTLAFSQMSATGKLMGQDLLQMINAGFNPLMEISRKTGKSISELKDEMSAGSISAEMVAEAFASATSEGGQFYGMLEKQGKGLAGQLNTLQGAIDDMMNSIGEESEGVIVSVVGGLTDLIKNYEKVGQILMSLIATYGAYRAAVMVAVLAEKGYTIATYAAATAQAVLNATMLMNPYVLAAVALGALVTTMVAFSGNAAYATKAQEKFNEQQEEAANKASERKQKTEELLSVIKDEAESDYERVKALNTLKSFYPEIFKEYDVEKLRLADILELKQKIAEEDRKRRSREIDKDLEYWQGEEERLVRLNNGETRDSLPQVRENVNKLLNEKSKEVAKQYEESLKEVDRETRDYYIKVLRDRMKGPSQGGYVRMALPTGKDGRLSGEVAFTKDELQALIDLTKSVDTPKAESKPKENKKYWEDKKKEAQSRLEALTAIQAAGKEGEAIRKEIKSYEDKLSMYSPKTQSKADKDRVKAEREIADEIAAINADTQRSAIESKRDGVDKRLELAKHEYEQEVAALDKKHATLVEKKGGRLSAEEEKAFTDAKLQAEEIYRQKATDIANEEWKTQYDAMNDYLSRYGTYQQRKLAIAAQYGEKIAKATSEGERRTLAAEKSNAMAQVDTEAIKSSIDWASVFGSMSGMLSDEMKSNLSQLQAYMKTDEFGSLDAQNQQEIVSLAEKIQSFIGSDIDFSVLSNGMANLKSAMADLSDAKERETEAASRANAAIEEYNKAVARGETDLKSYTDAVDAAMTEQEQASASVMELGLKAKETADSVSENTKRLSSSINGVAEGISKLKSSSLSTAYEGLGQTCSNLSTLIGGKVGASLSKFAGSLGGIAGQIAEAALGLLDVLKDGISSIITGLVDMVYEAINGILKDVLSGKIVTSSLMSVFEGLRTTWDTITFGAFSSGGIFGGNAKEVAKTIERLTERNEKLQQSIEDLTDEISSLSGARAIEASTQAEQYQKELNRNLLDISKAQASYSSAHHSFNYYWNGFTQEQIDRLSQQIGRSWSGNLWDLSPEEMKTLRSNVDMWEQIGSTGKGGYGGRVQEKLDDYIEQSGKLEDITNALYETLTATTADNIFDEFLSSLYDLADGAEDVFDNLSESWRQMVNKMVVNNLVGAKFQEEINDWYEDLAELNRQRTEGLITDREYKQRLDELKNERDRLIEEAERDVESLKESGIIVEASDDAYSQDSTKGGFQSMSQDTAEELNGRFTALQMNSNTLVTLTSSIQEAVRAQAQDIEAIRSSTEQSVNIGLDCVSHLAAIEKNTNQLFEMNDRLYRIEQNTKNL